ncbi:hypothetical protein H7T43_15610 [Peribacillus simplex]|nr:hypothetical protein [Peribacillus simplex]
MDNGKFEGKVNLDEQALILCRIRAVLYFRELAAFRFPKARLHKMKKTTYINEWKANLHTFSLLSMKLLLVFFSHLYEDSR